MNKRKYKYISLNFFLFKAKWYPPVSLKYYDNDGK